MVLSVSTHRRAEAATIVARGEVDLATVDRLRDEIHAVIIDGDATAILIDLSGVTFLDSSGISVLLHGRKIAEGHGKSYRLTGATGLVRQILEMTGVLAHLTGSAG